jgi:predicted lipoprotein with Yx(FWY)xxD motif
MQWYQDGVLHRDGDKPAVIFPDGRKQWWHHGRPVRDEEGPS